MGAEKLRKGNKKDFDYLSFTSQWPNNFERL
jgi:hypothetical protein